MEQQALKPPPERACKLIAVIGVNGTGKTTAVIRLLKSMNGKALILTPHCNEYEKYPHNNLEKPSDFRFSGICKNYFPSRELMQSVVKYFYDGTLVLEESRIYIENQPTPLNYALLNGMRQRMTDIIFVGHAFSDVPPLFLNRMTRILLFQTLEKLERRKGALLYFDLFKETQEEVNRKALKNPHFCKLIKL
ncbi:MAG: ATP-binding protein [Prevotellaceae bacterium]|nr:ATP-binding protein [Prevotellaceae bacterium]